MLAVMATIAYVVADGWGWDPGLESLDTVVTAALLVAGRVLLATL